METDYRGSRPFPLMVSRAYNSIDGGWQVFPEIRFVPGEVAVQVIRPDGKGLTYFPFSGTSWRATGTDITGELDRLVDSSGIPVGWRYRTLDDQVELYDEQGRIASATQRSGISHSYSYTASDITVTHSFGGGLVYALDSDGRITGFTDPGGNTYGYDYDANGLITAVTYPDNSGSRTYHYDDPINNDLLTGISDGNDNRFATWTYDNKRRAISSEHSGSAERETFDYSFVDDPDFPQTKVRNALGKDTTYHYFTVNGARKVFHVTGHASPNCVASNQSYGFDASAFIASKTDWKDNVTSYVRNARGQELSRTEATGSPQERTITTDWHSTFNLPIKIAEPGRETTFTYDASGNELNRSVVDTTSP
jgi:YD repeat-containing protein